MLGNLKNPPEPFADIIRTHFRLKAKSISAQLDVWLKADDGRLTTGDGGAYSSAGALKTDSTGSTNGFAKDIEELKKILKKLEN